MSAVRGPRVSGAAPRRGPGSTDLAPRLESNRLVLRGWQPGDLDAYASIRADPEVARYLGGVEDRAASWRRMATIAGHWVLRGYGLWAIERREDRALIGSAGLWRPEGWPGLEVAWTLAHDAWGSGFATEAARAAMQWGWEELHADQLISLILPHNRRSMRVATRLGMRVAREQMVAGNPAVVFVIQRPER